MPGPVTQSRSQGFGTSASARSLAFSSNVTAASLLAVAVTTYNTGGDVTVAVSDDINGSHSQAGSYTTQSNERASIWYFPNSGSGACTVTVTPSANAYVTIAIHEIAGRAAASPVRGTSNGTQFNTTPSTGTVTAVSGDVVLATFGFSGPILTSILADSPFADLEQVLDGSSTEGIATAYHEAAASESGSWVCNTNVGWQAIGVSFKPLLDTGSGNASVSFSASGQSAAESVASGASTLTMSASGAGAMDFIGSGASEFTITASGAGLESSGSGASTVSFSASGAASLDVIGSGAASMSFSGNATGIAESAGSGSVTLTFSGNAEGVAFTFLPFSYLPQRAAEDYS